jgi:site-specific DNA-adenine methylase
MFSYYGSKSKIVKYYPCPAHDKIIEPFAGSARYSLLNNAQYKISPNIGRIMKPSGS